MCDRITGFVVCVDLLAYNRYPILIRKSSSGDIRMCSISIRHDLGLLMSHVTVPTGPMSHVVLIVVSGLPGSGKSYFSRRVSERVPIIIVETDAMRKVLFSSPIYSAAESSRLFKACHALIEGLLRKGNSVLFDATNLVEHNREHLYAIADKSDAKLIIVRVEAPLAVVSERLRKRENGDTDISVDNSTADLSVYRRMVKSVEPIRRNHFAVDTSLDINPVINKIVREMHRWIRSQ